MTATPFRWLLALVALLMPAAVSCRDVSTSSEAGAKPEAAEVVFRHYTSEAGSKAEFDAASFSP